MADPRTFARRGPRRTGFALAGIFMVTLVAGCSREGAASQSGAPWLEDATQASRVDFLHDSGHRKRFFIPEDMCGGCCVFDYDKDGWMDLYFIQCGPFEPTNEPRKANQLFRNRGDGTFEDTTARAGVGAATNGIGCACGDYDGDGDPDVFVSNYGPDILYRNNGDGTFTDVTAQAGVTGPGFGSSAAFVDYDQDGDLDLFVVQYLNWNVGTEIKCNNPHGEPDYCKPDNYQAPALPILYRNAGNGTFEDVTAEAGLAAVAGNGLGIACADYNGDGHTDFFVANDGDPNRLWINDGKGRFTDRALLAGCAVSAEGVERAGMGVAAVDVLNNGRFDLFVTNLVLETNGYYRNLGDGMFVEKTSAVGLANPSRPFTAFGLGFRDFDHDGRLDLYVGNGAVVSGRAAAGATDRYAEPDQLFRGVEGGNFEEVFPRGGTAAPIVKAARAVAFGDLDNDCDVDVVVVNRDSRADILRNIAQKRGNAVMFRVRNTRGSDAIGALVRVTAGGVTRSENLMPSYSYCASSDPRLHFGLGAATEATAVSVRWPGGKTETFGPFPAGKLHEIREGTGK